MGLALDYTGTFYAGRRAVATFAYAPSGCQTVSLTAAGRTETTVVRGAAATAAPHLQADMAAVLGLPESEVFQPPHANPGGPGGPAKLPLRSPDLQLAEQVRGGGRDRVDRVGERLGVVPGRGAEAADLPHVLQRGSADVVVSDVLGVGRAERLDASAHITTVRQVRPSRLSRPTVSPGGRVAARRMPSSTPGMNEARSSESCLIVSVSPCPPNSTSW